MWRITKNSWLLFGILLAALWLIPLTGPLGAAKLLGPHWILVALVLVFPLLTWALALTDGVQRGFSPWWTILPAVFFGTTLFVYYNDSALIYAAFFAVAGTIGSSIGALIRSQVTRRKLDTID